MASKNELPMNQAVAQVLALSAAGLKFEPTKKSEAHVRLDAEVQKYLAEAKPPESLSKAVGRMLDQQGEVERLAFESDPTAINRYHSIYKVKYRLVPDKLIKRILIQDDLVAAIVQTRQAQMSAFGRPRPDRFSTGFVIEPRQEALEQIERTPDPDQKRRLKDELQQRIAKATKRLMSCGDDNLDISGNQDKLTFPQYISMSVRNAIGLGRIATEVLWGPTVNSARVFKGFRVIDAGTIYRAEPQQNALNAVRRQARMLLAQIKNERLDPEKFSRDEYKWVQVIDDRPIQAFTADECLVHNFYPVPDVEMDGYPVTPIDTVLSAITTHINITTHNKLYFQSGRATRGMLIIKSDDVDESIVARVRQQFNAQINSVTNAWRMPVFGVGQDDEITWQPIDNGSRDMEFQYLSDSNAREIMSAFQMSPEELPGYAHLSRGTNNQALSESNNEYRLEAARDVGIRPLLAQFEDFLNQEILPLFDKGLAETCALKLVGLDAETAEKESVRLQQDAPVHMTYDEVLEKVEKQAVGKAMGGEFPLNPAYQQILDKYFTVGEIKEFFMGHKGAAQDPQWMYVRDPFWFQQQQNIQAQQQMQMQQQQAAQQAAQGGPPPQGGEEGGGGDQPPPGEEKPSGEAAKPTQEQSQTENQKSASAEQGAPPGGDLTNSVNQAMGALSKAEAQLPPSKRRLLHQQKLLVLDFVKGWEHDLPGVMKDILDDAERLTPKR